MTATSLELKVLMYHFIHQPNEPFFENYQGITQAQFESQVETLLKTHQPISSKQLASHFETKNLTGKYFYLTFDDGIRQHFTNVLPFLKAKGLEAAFFPVSGPISEQKVPPIEMQRFLQYGAFPSYPQFLRAYFDTLKSLGIRAPEPTDKNMAHQKNYLKQFGFYSKEERYFRWIRDEYLNPNEYKKSVATLFESFFPEEKNFVSQFYTSWEELKQIQEEGMVIGCHSHWHPLLTSLSTHEINKELTLSINDHKNKLGKAPEILAYPNGKHNSQVETVSKQLGFRLAFATGNQGNDNSMHPLRIQRIDAASYHSVGL